MNLDAVLARGRARAESRMTETIRAGRVDDGTDPVSGDAVQTVVEPFVYEGIARVKYPDTAVSDSESASQVVSAQTVTISVPVAARIIPEGSGITVTASDADGSLVDRTYRVDGAPAAGQTTAHRYPVTEFS